VTDVISQASWRRVNNTNGTKRGRRAYVDCTHRRHSRDATFSTIVGRKIVVGK